mgnify:CR=1 FL=1
MLEQAIIDAEELKKTAIQVAEKSIVEKYSKIKRRVYICINI